MTMMLALILLAAVTAAGIGAAVLIVTEFNTRASSNNGIKAYYAADAGMERALFTIFNGRLEGRTLASPYSSRCWKSSSPSSNMYVCDQIASNAPLTTQPPFLNGAQISLDKTSVYDANSVVTIPRNLTVEYNYASTTETYSVARSIVVQAPDLVKTGCDDECMKKTAGIEVRWSYLLRTGQSSDVAPANSTVRVFSLDNVKYGAMVDLFTGTTFPSIAGQGHDLTLQNPSGVTEIPSNVNFNQISGWVIRVTALSTTVPNLTLIACTGAEDCTNTSAKISNRSNTISVTSQGVVGSSSITLNARVPWYIPSIGIFDYAIFSEESLIPD